MSGRSPFYEEWRQCLREHYLYVVRVGDSITEPTLRQVLMSTGFTEEDLAALREWALSQSPQGRAEEPHR